MTYYYYDDDDDDDDDWLNDIMTKRSQDAKMHHDAPVPHATLKVFWYDFSVAT